MKFIFFFLLSIQSVFASDNDPKLTENNDTIERYDVKVCSDGDYESELEVHPDSPPPKTLTEFIEDIKSELTPGRIIEKVVIRLCCVDDDAFERIYQEVLTQDAIKNSVKIIDLAHNFFGHSDKTMDFLQSILNFPQLHFLNLTSSGLSFSGITLLAKSIVTNAKDYPLEKIGKIIFQDKGTIKLVKNKSKFIEMTQQEYFPKNWLDRHEEFYELGKPTLDDYLSLTSSETSSA